MEPIATSAAARTPQVIELATEETIVYELTWRIRIKPGKRRILRRLTPQLLPKKTTSVPKERPIAKVLPAIRERKRSASRENDLKRETIEEILKPPAYDKIQTAPVLVYTCTVEKDTETKEGSENEQNRQGDDNEENAHGNIAVTNKESPLDENKEQEETASQNRLGLRGEETICENREEQIEETTHLPQDISPSENKPPVNEEKDNFNQENKSSEHEKQDNSNQQNELVKTDQDNPDQENREQDHSNQVDNSSAGEKDNINQENKSLENKESSNQEDKSQANKEQESFGQEINLFQESPQRDKDKTRGWTDPCTSHRDWERKLVFLLEEERKASERRAPGNMECVNGEGCHTENTDEIQEHRQKETSITDCLEEFLKGLHLTHLLDYLKVLGCMCVRDLRLLEMPELEAIQLISRRRLLQQLDTLSLHHEAPPEGCSLEAWLTWYGLTHISGFLTAIGVHSVGDLGYLKEEDLLLLKPVTRRRILACHKNTDEKRRMLNNGLVENDYLM